MTHVLNFHHPPSPTSTFFFEIDNALLRKEARKPKYVAQRYFEPRSFESVTLKRTRLLQEKRAKLQMHLHHVQGVYTQQKEWTSKQAQQKWNDLCIHMQKVNENRQAWMLQKQKHSRHHHAFVQAKVKQQQYQTLEKANHQRQQCLQKLNLSEWRRSHLKRISKKHWLTYSLTRSSSSTVLPKVIHIQSWWRYHRLSPLLEALKQLHLPLLHQGSFMESAAKLQQRHVLHTTHLFLKRVLKMSATHLHDEVKRLSGMKMTRLFLMVFMVLAHPKEIVEDPEGEVQKQLIASANSVFDHFSSLASYRPSSSSSMSPFLTRFVQSWLTFTLTFHRFKEKDMDLVVTTLVNHAVTLAQLLKDVSEHPHANQEFQPNVMKQWKVLHQRILEVGGEKAWNQCCEVLKQHHLEEILAVEDHLNEQEKEKEKEKEKDKDNEVKQTEKKDKVNEKRLSFTFTSSTPSPSLSPTNTTSSSSFSFSESSSLTSSPSSPTFGSLQTSTTPTSSSPTPPPPAVEQLLDNHHLAHEIIMDPSFELKPASSTSTSTSDVLHHQIKSMATLAFKHRIQEAWDQHQYGFIEDLVLEIQTSLSSMTHSERVKDTLKDVLDVKRVQKQIQVGQVDIQGLLKSIVDWMLRLAAPIRDASIRSILSATSVSEAVVQIHAMLETMHLDLANYYIQQLRPYLQTRAITYETAQFAQSLKDSSSTLPNTRAWLSLSVEQWHTNYQSRNPENLPCVTPNFEDLYHDAVVQLVMNPPSIQQWPETCHLDQHRLQTFSQEVQGLLGLATYSLLVKPKSPSSSSSSSENDRQLLLDHFRTHPSTTFHTLPIPVPTTLLWTKPVHEHPVYLILTRRVHTVLKQTCTQPLPVNALPSYGLDSVTDLLQKLAHALRAFCQHNKAVHATWYDALFKDILQTTVTES